MGFLNNTKNKVSSLTAMAGIFAMSLFGTASGQNSYPEPDEPGPKKELTDTTQNKSKNGNSHDGNGTHGIGANGGNGGVDKAWSVRSGLLNQNNKSNTVYEHKKGFDHGPSDLYIFGAYLSDNSMFTQGLTMGVGAHVGLFKYGFVKSEYVIGNQKMGFNQKFEQNLGLWGGQTTQLDSWSWRPAENRNMWGLQLPLMMTDETGHGMSVTPYAFFGATTYPGLGIDNLWNTATLSYGVGADLNWGHVYPQEDKSGKNERVTGRSLRLGVRLNLEQIYRQNFFDAGLGVRQPPQGYRTYNAFEIHLGLNMETLYPEHYVKIIKNVFKSNKKSDAPAAPTGTQTKPVGTTMIDAVIPSGNRDGLEILDSGRQPKNAVVLETAQKNKADVTGFTQPTPTVNTLSYSYSLT